MILKTVSKCNWTDFDIHPRSASRDHQTNSSVALSVNDFCLLRGVDQQSCIGLVFNTLLLQGTIFTFAIIILVFSDEITLCLLCLSESGPLQSLLYISPLMALHPFPALLNNSLTLTREY